VEFDERAGVWASGEGLVRRNVWEAEKARLPLSRYRKVAVWERYRCMNDNLCSVETTGVPVSKMLLISSQTQKVEREWNLIL
jgi:hypothetical protein